MAFSRRAAAGRFLLRSLSLRGATFLLALLAVTVGGAMIATMLGIEADLGAKMSRELRGYGPNLLVTPGEGPAGALDAGAVARAAGGAEGTSQGTTGVRLCPMLIVTGTLRAAAPGGTTASHSPAAVESSAVSSTSGSNPGHESASGATGSAGTAPSEGGTAAPGTDLGRDPAKATIPGSATAPMSSDERIEHGSLFRQGAAATIVGTDLAGLRDMYPAWRLLGSWPDEASGDIVVGSSLAKRAGLAVGSAALLRLPALTRDPSSRRAFTEIGVKLAGIVSTGEAGDEQVFLALRRLREAAGAPSAPLSLIALSIDGGAGAVTRAASSIERETGAAARPLRAIAAAQGAILGKLQRMMLLLTLAVLSLSGLCLVTTLMASVVERESEIGLMRSIGAGDGEIITMFVGEVSLLGIIGGVAGVAIGSLAARVAGSRLFGTAITFRPGIVPIVLGLSLALSIASVLIPLRRALAVQPATALRGD